LGVVLKTTFALSNILTFARFRAPLSFFRIALFLPTLWGLCPLRS